MIKRTNILLFILLAPFLMSGCFENFGGCAPDAERLERQFYRINLNGQVEAIENEWKRTYGGDGDLVEIYGLDEANNFLFFTEDYIRSSGDIIRLNYLTKEKESFIIDEHGQRFRLSPDGKRFLYEKYLGKLEFNVYIANINDTLGIPVPKDSTFTSIRYPKWHTNNEIMYASQDALYKVNLIDSTIEKLAKKYPFFGYDISGDQQVIVLSGYEDVSDPNSEKAVYLKHSSASEISFLVLGSYPILVPNRDKLIYETSSDIMLTDFEGNRQSLYAKNSTRSYSENHQIALSPTGNKITITEADGIYLIDIPTIQIQKLVSQEEFIPTDSEWESISTSFTAPIFSTDGSEIFFSLTLDYWDDGC